MLDEALKNREAEGKPIRIGVIGAGTFGTQIVSQICGMTGYRMTVVTPKRTETRDVSPRLLPWAEKPWHGIQESVLNIQQH